MRQVDPAFSGGATLEVNGRPGGEPEVSGASQQRADEGVEGIVGFPARAVVSLPSKTRQRGLELLNEQAEGGSVAFALVRAAREPPEAEGRSRVHLHQETAPSPVNRPPGVSEGCKQAGSPHRDGRDPIRTDCERNDTCHGLCDVQVGSAARKHPPPLETRLAGRGGCSPGTMSGKEIHKRFWPPERAVQGCAFSGDERGKDSLVIGADLHRLQPGLRSAPVDGRDRRTPRLR